MLARVLCIALVVGMASVQGVEDDSPALTSRVNRAIVCGVERLRATQAADGSWGGVGGEHPGGMTALCAFALVKSGALRSDAAVRKALDVVLATEFRSTYSHSVRLLLLDALSEPERWRASAAPSLDFLVANQVAGDWAYPWGAADASNTQFALLGLAAAHRMGLEIPDATLVSAAKAIFRAQDKSGGFVYVADRAPTGGITAASLAGLCVLRELGSGRSSVESVLRKNAQQDQRAREWLTDKWSPARNAHGARAWTPTFHYPYLWSVERFGGFAGVATLGVKDWYAEGALWLVDEQNDDGGWGTKLEDTCFALLFLRRASVTRGEGIEESDASLDALRKPNPPTPASEIARWSDWLLAGPWPGSDPHGALAKLPFDPQNITAKPGEKLAKREWKRVVAKTDGWTDLDQLSGQSVDNGFYAMATNLVWSSDEPLDATLWLDLEDGWDLYLDGARVSFSERVQAPIDGLVAVDLVLTRGEHTLLCLVEDHRGAAAFGARLSDRAGRPLKLAPDVHAVRPKSKPR